MTEVENMEKQLLQLETFVELTAFITASGGTATDIDGYAWRGLYSLARKNPQVRAHLEGLALAGRDQLGSSALDILLTK